MQLIKVRLRKPTRVYTFLSRDVFLQRHEDCIVNSDRGLEWGTCVAQPEACPLGMEERYTMEVVRKAEEKDFSTLEQITREEERAHSVCRSKINERSLPMKLVDTEYMFDKKKVVFSFTAEDRVDFRQLVKDLAHELRTRIELRHIQVRDEAKVVGGLGACGRELCCATWLRDFMPISMKMAKRQNLSLNPTKISGQCGRLMCCLSYENDQYSSSRQYARARIAEEESLEKEESILTSAPVGIEALPELKHRTDQEAEQRKNRDRSREGRPQRRPERSDVRSDSRPEPKSPMPEKSVSDPKPQEKADAAPKADATGDDAAKPRRRRRGGRGRRRGKRGGGGASGGNGAAV